MKKNQSKIFENVFVSPRGCWFVVFLLPNAPRYQTPWVDRRTGERLAALLETWAQQQMCFWRWSNFSKLCALFSVRFRIRGKHIFNQQKLQVFGRFVSGDAVIMKEPAPEGGELVRSLTRPGRVFVVRQKSTQQPRVEMPWKSISPAYNPNSKEHQPSNTKPRPRHH